jgi:hypothetical protein
MTYHSAATPLHRTTLHQGAFLSLQQAAGRVSRAPPDRALVSPPSSRILLLLQASNVQGVYAFPLLGAAHARQYRTDIESFERQTDRNMAEDSYSFWRFGHSQATYVGQLERSAARDGSASTYEREWHDSFVNGRRNCALVNGDGSHGLGRLFPLGFNGGRDMEFRPELPAPRSRPPRANPFYAVSAEDIYTARDPTDPNYFSDPESERTASVAEEYKAAERAERAGFGFDEETSAQQSVVAKENQLRSSTRKDGKLVQKQQQTPSTKRKMAGRGRGRPGGNLKGITWEYDPSIKLESKPIELFPVRVTPTKLLKFLTLPSLIQT